MTAVSPAFSALPGEILDEGARGPVGVIELVGEVVEVDVGVERVVDPVLDAVDVLGCLVDEVAHLVDDDRTDRERRTRLVSEQDEDEHQAGRRGRAASRAGRAR